MERITESVLLKAGKSVAWQGVVNKIDIDALIEFEYGLEIEWDNLDHLAPGEAVLAAIVPQRKLIYMNETQKALFEEKMGTMNFSKAHELGHWILHVTENQEYEQLTFDESEIFYCRSSSRAPREIQADMFAAAILMPKEIVCGAINELKGKGAITFPDLYKLRDDFEVSISALTKRIKELNLLYFEGKKIYQNEAEAQGQLTLL